MNCVKTMGWSVLGWVIYFRLVNHTVKDKSSKCHRHKETYLKAHNCFPAPGTEKDINLVLSQPDLCLAFWWDECLPDVWVRLNCPLCLPPAGSAANQHCLVIKLNITIYWTYTSNTSVEVWGSASARECIPSQESNVTISNCNIGWVGKKNVFAQDVILLRKIGFIHLRREDIL